MMAVDVPDQDRCIAAGCGQQPAVRGKYKSLRGSGVSVEAVAFLARGDLPQAQRPVHACAGQDSTVGRKSNRGDPVFVSDEHLDLRSAAHILDAYFTTNILPVSGWSSANGDFRPALGKREQTQEPASSR